MHFCQLYNQWLNLGVIMAYIQRSWWHPTPVLLPGKSHGQRSLVGCSPWGHKKSDTTEWLPFHFSLSCTGEGNGNPLSCLENPRDGGSCWAAIYGVAQSWTWLKWLSSSSSMTYIFNLSEYWKSLFQMVYHFISTVLASSCCLNKPSTASLFSF